MAAGRSLHRRSGVDHQPRRESNRAHPDKDHHAKRPLIVLVWIDHFSSSIRAKLAENYRVAALRFGSPTSIVKGYPARPSRPFLSPFRLPPSSPTKKTLSLY